jgi:hypothetical protein
MSLQDSKTNIDVDVNVRLLMHKQLFNNKILKRL